MPAGTLALSCFAESLTLVCLPTSSLTFVVAPAMVKSPGEPVELLERLSVTCSLGEETFDVAVKETTCWILALWPATTVAGSVPLTEGTRPDDAGDTG